MGANLLPYSVTTGVDNALSGTGNQRAVQGNSNIYGDGSVNNYLNINAFAPAPGTYSTLKPNAFHGPSVLQNDVAFTRNFPVASRRLQFRREIFNVIKTATFPIRRHRSTARTSDASSRRAIRESCSLR